MTRIRYVRDWHPMAIFLRLLGGDVGPSKAANPSISGIRTWCRDR
jgi:hypothetical protein